MSCTSGLPSLRSRAGKARQRFSATYLKATEAAATALRLQQEQDEQNARPFRFLDLALELQEIVYGFYAADVERKYKPARSIEIPALAHVCQEIRDGFLPIFFNQGKFTIVIGPYIPPPSAPRRWSPQWSSEALLNRTQKAQDPNDPILLSKHMSTLFSPPLVVRDVELSCHELNYRLINNTAKPRKRRGGWFRWPSGRERLALDLKWENGKLKTQVSPRFSDVPGKVEIFARSIGEARKICAREEFNGFTVEDLRRIASAMMANNGEADRQ